MKRRKFVCPKCKAPAIFIQEELRAVATYVCKDGMLTGEQIVSKLESANVLWAKCGCGNLWRAKGHLRCEDFSDDEGI